MKQRLTRYQTAYGSGNYKKSLDYSYYALMRDEKDYNALAYFAASLAKLGFHENAIKVYTLCFAIRDNDYLIWLLRGDCFYEIGAYEYAIRDYKKSLLLEPGYAVEDRLARALFRAGYHDEAIYVMRHVVEKGESPEPICVFIMMLNEMGRNGEAYNTLLLGKKLFPLREKFTYYYKYSLPENRMRLQKN